MGKSNNLKIVIISFDWKNIFVKDFPSFLGKLKRDRLNPQTNDFFIISWGKESYYKQTDNFQIVHLKTIFGRCRFVYDLLSVFLTPLILKKYSFRPDIFLVYDFPLITAGLWPKIFWRTKIVLFLGNLPAVLVAVRPLALGRKIYQRGCEILFKGLVNNYFIISRATKYYVLKLGVKERKIKMVIPNILERDREFILTSDGGAVRQKYNIAPDKRIWLSVGRLEPEKGFFDLINIFKEIGRNDSILIIAGEGVLKDALAAQVKRLDLEKKVILAGNVSRQAVWDYYRDADLFILLSLSEGLGVVFWEAMFCGVSVLGRRIDAIEESIGANEERGFLWQASDGVKKLKEKIDLCLAGGPIVEEKKRQACLYAQALGENKEDINYYFNNKS